MKTLALCSESTGKAKLAVVSVGTIGEATEKAKVCSLPVTPCMELPGDPSMLLILSLGSGDPSCLGMKEAREVMLREGEHGGGILIRGNR